MWRRGVIFGVIIAIAGWLWLRMQRAVDSPTQTTIQLPVQPSADVQRSSLVILHQIETTAPWILKVNEKSSIKS